MSNIIISTPELSDAANLSPSSETTAGPATNLQKMQKSDVWEASGSNPSIDIDLGSVQSLGFFALLYMTGVPAGAICALATSDTQGGLSTPDYAAGFPSFAPVTDGDYTHLIHVPSVAVNNRWVRIQILTAAGATFGRLYVSAGYRPSVNYRYGYEDGFEDAASIDITDGGGLIPGPSLDRRILNLTLLSLSETERHNLREIIRRRNATRDVCIVTDPDAAANLGDRIYYGLLSARRATVQNRFNLHETPLQLVGL